jgi:aspartate/methionine/tyrosine aminotransferase
VTGPARLVAAVSKAHQFVTFTVASSLQRAVAYGLDHEAVFYTCASASAMQAQRPGAHT